MTRASAVTRLPVAVTMGEPAGIGVEILLKAWLRRREAALPPLVAVADPYLLRETASRLGLDVPVIDAVGNGLASDDALVVVAVPLVTAVVPGRLDVRNAAAVIAAIDKAVALALAGHVAAVVTNPIQKSVLAEAGFKHPGHTEYLAEITHAARPPVMMLAIEGLRVVPVTIHVALKDVAARLTADAIVAAGETTAAALNRDFGIASPRLAFAALNPHAGEAGLMGSEEATILAPAIARLAAQGIDVRGPSPADTLFHARARTQYDAVLCMYHDQALIPLKTLDFDNGVNVTLGLPIVRTSPDHGTALDIAGMGTADPSSLIAAIRMADAMAARRRA